MGNLEKPIPEPKFTPYQFYACMIEDLRAYGCQANKKDEHWTDCFFYSEEQDMHAYIPCCGYKQTTWGEEFDCNGCHAYVTNKTVHTLIKSMIDNGEFDKLEEEKDAK